MNASRNSEPYKPALPLTVKSSSVLSQDVITSASILVESTSSAPVAAFTNPTSTESEALAIINKQICHIARDRNKDSGWRAIPLFNGQAVEHVAAAVPFQTKAYGFFIDPKGQLYSTMLGADGKTWSTPGAVPNGLMSHPRVAYTANGAAVVYGVSSKGDLVTAWQQGMTAPFTAIVHPCQGALAGDDFQLCMLDEEAFTVFANVGGKAYTITGDVDQPEIVGPALAPQFTQTVTNVALGYVGSAGLSPTAIFLVAAEDKDQKQSGLHCWSQVGNNQAVVQKVANGSIALATGHVSTDSSLHVYAIDNDLGLWVLHQSSLRPWREDGTPNWAPFLPLDKGIGRVICDMNPAAVPSLFAIDGGDYSLRLHAIDPDSRMWKCQKILQRKEEVYEVTRHRVEVRVMDANARALPNHAVTVTVEKGNSAVEVWAGGQLHLVNEKGSTLTTGLNGKLTIAVTATEHGLACPNLIVNCEGLAQAATVRPAGALHEYLSGNGTLNPTNPSDRGGGPLPQFDSGGETLKAARVNGKLFAPGATAPESDPKTAANVAGAIQHGAQLALGNTPAGVHGFGGCLVTSRSDFQVFHTAEALRAHAEGAGLAQVGGFWDDIKAFFADIFEGIKNFVIKIAHFVVKVIDKIVEFTLDMAEFVGKVLHLDISGIEKAASFMHGFFNSVDAGIDEVVKWLEALFDFAAIWRTKMAIQEAIEGFCPYAIKVCVKTQQVVDGWFAQQKEKVNAAFDALELKYAGQTYGHLENWQDPCAPASRKPVAGKAAPSDFTDNPHHNWLHDKVTSYPPDSSSLHIGDSVDDLWNTAARHFADSGVEFQKALTEFRNAIWDTITDPSSFATKAIPEFIEMARHLALAMLDLLDAIVDSVAALIGTAMELVNDLLKAELPLGFLNTLWKWMAEAVGHPEDATLNLYSLSALLVALPSTLIYKLAVGVDHEPFPTGKLPAPHSQLGIVMAWQSVLTSDIVRMVQVTSAGASDFWASDSPGWLAGLNVCVSGAVWVLRHGYPDEWEDLLLALMLSGGFFGHFVPEAIAKWRSFHKHDANDIVAGLSTVYGIGALSYGIYIDSTTKLRRGLSIANILTPLPSVFSWLTLSNLRLNVELAPFAIGGNMVFDAVGYVGGGLELMLDTLIFKPKLEIAEA